MNYREILITIGVTIAQKYQISICVKWAKIRMMRAFSDLPYVLFKVLQEYS